jgi:transposase
MPKVDIFEELKRERKEKEFYKKQAEQWQKKYYAVEKRLKDVESKLNRILNCNTPSSQVPFTEKDTNKSPNRQAKGTNPRGKPKGGNGGTRSEPTEIDRTEKATTDKCDGCGSSGLKHVDTERVYVWDFPVLQLIVTLFLVYIYKCKKCGKEVKGKHADLPKSGIFGPNLASFLIETRQKFAGSYGKLSEFLHELTGETFSRQSIKDLTRRVGSDLQPSYNKIREKLTAEIYAHIDETKWPIDGKHFYLWLFCTANYVFIAIKNSRGRKVVTSVLGDMFNGVIISDCLKVYDVCASAFQKCWSHLLRKTFDEAKKHPKSDVKLLHRMLSDLYTEAETYRKSDLTESRRIWTGIMMTQKLQMIKQYKWKNKSSKGIIANWLTLFEGHWLVGVFMPEVELTNNRDERGIRKVIPTRRMLGGHRTEEGANDFAVIETHRQTWKLKGHSPYTKLNEFFRNQNMGKTRAIA